MINSLKQEKTKVVNFKMSQSDWQKIQRLAKRFAHGNASRWLRVAALNYKPVSLKS